MSEKIDPQKVDLGNYEKNYSESGLWDKIKGVAKMAGKPIIKNVLTLYYALQSGNVSGMDKAKIIGALGYFILPLDLIPDALPVVGFTDDATLLLFVLKIIRDAIDDWVKAQTEKKLKEWF